VRKFQVCVIGSSDATYEQYSTAYEIGKYAGTKGWVLINGGRGGVMEASSKGAEESSGVAVSIFPFDDIDKANAYTTISIATTIGYARNCITVASGDCVVIVGGKSGTLCELTFAWQMGKTIFSCSWVEGVSMNYADKKLDDKREDRVIAVHDLTELFEKLDNFYEDWLSRRDN